MNQSKANSEVKETEMNSNKAEKKKFLFIPFFLFGW